jgi:hypothetical protein
VASVRSGAPSAQSNVVITSATIPRNNASASVTVASRAASNNYSHAPSRQHTQQQLSRAHTVNSHASRHPVPSQQYQSVTATTIASNGASTPQPTSSALAFLQQQQQQRAPTVQPTPHSPNPFAFVTSSAAQQQELPEQQQQQQQKPQTPAGSAPLTEFILRNGEPVPSAATRQSAHSAAGSNSAPLSPLPSLNNVPNSNNNDYNSASPSSNNAAEVASILDQAQQQQQMLIQQRSENAASHVSAILAAAAAAANAFNGIPSSPQPAEGRSSAFAPVNNNSNNEVCIILNLIKK